MGNRAWADREVRGPARVFAAHRVAESVAQRLEQSFEMVGTLALDNLRAFFAGEPPPNRVA